MPFLKTVKPIFRVARTCFDEIGKINQLVDYLPGYRMLHTAGGFLRNPFLNTKDFSKEILQGRVPAHHVLGYFSTFKR